MYNYLHTSGPRRPAHLKHRKKRTNAYLLMVSEMWKYVHIYDPRDGGRISRNLRNSDI